MTSDQKDALFVVGFIIFLFAVCLSIKHLPPPKKINKHYKRRTMPIIIPSMLHRQRTTPVVIPTMPHRGRGGPMVIPPMARFVAR